MTSCYVHGGQQRKPNSATIFSFSHEDYQRPTNELQEENIESLTEEQATIASEPILGVRNNTPRGYENASSVGDRFSWQPSRRTSTSFGELFSPSVYCNNHLQGPRIRFHEEQLRIPPRNHSVKLDLQSHYGHASGTDETAIKRVHGQFWAGRCGSLEQSVSGSDCYCYEKEQRTGEVNFRPSIAEINRLDASTSDQEPLVQTETQRFPGKTIDSKPHGCCSSSLKEKYIISALSVISFGLLASTITFCVLWRLDEALPTQCSDTATDEVDLSPKIFCTSSNLPGSVCTYYCSKKRTLQGPETSICTITGTWKPSQTPTCVCSGCYYGENCQKRISWSTIKKQLSEAIYGQKPAEFLYDDKNNLTCSVGWIQNNPSNFTCSCRNRIHSVTSSCYHFQDYRKACMYAAARHIWKRISFGDFKLPCDFMDMPSIHTLRENHCLD